MNVCEFCGREIPRGRLCTKHLAMRVLLPARYWQMVAKSANEAAIRERLDMEYEQRRSAEASKALKTERAEAEEAKENMESAMRALEQVRAELEQVRAELFQSTRPVWGATANLTILPRQICTKGTKEFLLVRKTHEKKGKIKQKLAYIHAFSAFLGCEGSRTFCALVLRTQYR